MCVIPVRVFRQPPLSPHFPHVLPISCDCLAPPHSPRIPHRAFHSPMYLSPHLSVDLCEFVICVFVILVSAQFILDSCHSYFLFILYPVFLRFVCKSCSCIFCLFWSVGLFSFFFCDSSPLYYTSLMCFSFGVFYMLNVILTSWL